jgi:hypothetical protein
LCGFAAPTAVVSGKIRLSVSVFMNGLFRNGAFQGQTPKEGYFVKCDAETTTQNDISLGVVNIIVGFAPLKPAEFVVIKIQQMAGRIETLLREIASHHRPRRKKAAGRGISALFVGKRGTGKKIAADVLASDLRLDLYRIDRISSQQVHRRDRKESRTRFRRREENGSDPALR